MATFSQGIDGFRFATAPPRKKEHRELNELGSLFRECPPTYSAFRSIHHQVSKVKNVSSMTWMLSWLQMMPKILTKIPEWTELQNLRKVRRRTSAGYALRLDSKKGNTNIFPPSKTLLLWNNSETSRNLYKSHSTLQTCLLLMKGIIISCYPR